MAYIVSYQKYINDEKTIEMNMPKYGDGKFVGSELATIDGVTYVSIPDDVTLPEQPSEITVTRVVLDDNLKTLISSYCPLIALINDEVKRSIAQKYSLEEEIRFLRTRPSAKFDQYNEFVESCRAKGRELKSKLGL